MKGMASAVGLKTCPPAGRYAFNITAADPGFTKVYNEGQQNQKGGDSQISLTLEIAEGEHAGYQAYDNLGTDGGTKYGAASKKRLRQLDVPGLDSDAEIPDDVIAQALLNRRVWAEVEREQRENKDGTKQVDIDEKTGLKTPLYRLKIVGYLRQPTSTTQATAPVQQLTPMTQPGYPTQMPQMAAAPGGWPAAPGGFAPPAPGAVPGGYAPTAAPGFPQVAPPPGWVAAPNGTPTGVPTGIPGQPGLPFPGAPGIGPR